MKKQKGFSLIELLIVVAIILIIAAIAIPNLLRAKIAANEASAVGSLRSIVTAEISYNTAGWTTGGQPIGFSDRLRYLGGTDCNPQASTATCLLDDVLAHATTASSAKSGYWFAYTATGPDPTNTGFKIHADPATPGLSGNRYFFVDESGVIRFNPSSTATAADNPLQ